MTITKASLIELLSQAGEIYKMLAPVKKDGILEYREISNAKEIDWSDDIAYKSPKEVVFPRIEKMMCFDASGDIVNCDGGDGCELEKKTILFGVRPCDLEALKVMNAVFTEGRYMDTAFAAHMKNTVLVGMGCKHLKPGCFCNERGIDKTRSVACDVFLTEQEEGYSVEAFSEKGADFLQTIGVGGLEVVREENGIAASADGNILEITADENAVFNEYDWERATEKCLGCGMCTYICPTCHCFEFKDTQENGGSSRYRCWDSCMYPKFTLHTSGHNPRATKKERYRQRVMHKYLYVKKNFGEIACTGCGRCIRSCPAGMNIKTIVRDIMEELQ